MARAEIRIDNAAVARMLNGSGGPVSRDLEKRGRRVATRARQLAPGSMKRKISVDLQSGHVRVECSHPATLFVVRKTQPHAIRPHPPRKMLRFKGKTGITFTRFVWHPGNRHPNNFLLRAMREASN